MAKTTRDEARLLNQCANGYRLRYSYSVPAIVAAARTNMTPANHQLADAIQNETISKAVFVAPCNGKITRCSANALTWPAGGTLTFRCYKANIGAGDTALHAATSIEGTNETVIDAVLSGTLTDLDVIEGQLVYVDIAVSNDAVTTRSNGMGVTVEFMPTEA